MNEAIKATAREMRPTPIGWCRVTDGRYEIRVGDQRPPDRSGGYSTPWAALYDTPGVDRAIESALARAVPESSALTASAQDAISLRGDETNQEVLTEFIRVCRDVRPVGQWPGERVCRAIEALMNGPRDFISPDKRSPLRFGVGRGNEGGRLGLMGRELAKSQIPDGFILVNEDRLTAIHSALSRHIGDTDPYVADDATDDEIRNEQPVFWAAQQLAFLTPSPSTRPPVAALKRHPSHDWIEDGDELL